MARAIVTNELAELLKSTRIENNIQAKDLAAQINRSASFISRLENGAVKSIDIDDLNAISKYLFSNASNQEVLLEQIYSSLRIKHSREEIESLIWFMNYDMVDRRIPIPNDFIKELNQLIDDSDISREILLTRINNNEMLPESIKSDSTIPFNTWIHVDNSECGPEIIKIRMSKELFDSIFSGKSNKSSYTFLLCIIFYIFKIMQHGSVSDITDADNNALLDKAKTFLYDHKIYTIPEKQDLYSASISENKVSDLLGSFDKDNLNIINDILSGFHFYSNYDVKAANQQLQALSDNMHWDLGFMMRILSIDYAKLNKMSVDIKRSLIADIEALIARYGNLPEEQKMIEKY